MTKANTPEWVKSELTHLDAAAARGQIEQTSGLRAQSAHYDTRKKLVLSCYAGAISAPKVAISRPQNALQANGAMER